MLNIFEAVRSNLEKDNRIPTKTLINLNPSSQVCYTESGVQVGSCLRKVWLDKTDKPKTNKIGLNAIMAGFSGNWWEEWLINQVREAGLYHSSQVALTDPSRLVKGIVDLVTKNPQSNFLELNEIKTYDGSNYNVSSSLLGNSKLKPKPKDAHLLQLVRYLICLLLDNSSITVGNLLYLDRACGPYSRNKQFQVTLEKIGDDHYPKIVTVDHKGEYYEYTDFRISVNCLLNTEETLLGYLSSNTIPPKDFKEVYTKEEIIAKHEANEIPDYIFKSWQKDPEINTIGDYQCRYCPFGNKGTCFNWEDDD